MKIKNTIKRILSSVLAASTVLSVIPTLTYAAQVNEYVDPADTWITANGRTNEFDFNATITQETGYCTVCERETIMFTYRVPEYTKTGETALNRGVKYSDGTMTDNVTTGNIDDGLPGVDAFYTTYHWTKSVCQICGTINSVDGPAAYNFNRNVYGLNSCDYDFFLDFDNTEYIPYNDKYHTTVLKKGQYCQFCKGTQARATEKQESHNFSERIDGQLGNNRFYVSEHCEDCGYETSEYITAKSVISSYYGTVDENAHTVTVSDLSDSGVHTSIRYGTSAGKCNLTSAPNYTEAGYYPVYYEIDYKYAGKNMTENGVSYVWLLEKDGDTIIVIPPTNSEEKHEHDFRYLETVAPSCDSLGYERWQCAGCGSLEKRNYTPATGHDYEDITIREATCKQGGLSLSLCKNCGDFHQTTTPTGEHKYKAEKHNPTCRITGYTEYVCEVCGDSYMNDITPIISHAFERITKQPTCTDKGYTTSTCTMCGLNYVSDYIEPTGHKWDEGHLVTSSTCENEGITEFHCLNCDEKMIKAESATGHMPGAAATCTEPQTCEKCGTILELPKGHHYDNEVISSTCTSMGYTIFKCTDCGDSYTGDFTDKAEHEYNTEITAPTCTAMGFTTYHCANCEDEYISDYTDKLPHSYKTEVKNPTCSEMGYTTYTCENCGDSYIGDYTDKTEHNYSQQVIPPTCTEHGYTIYKCPDCGKEYIGDLTECEKHTYKETVTAPTCTEMGYSDFVCESCGDSYRGSYTDVLGHDYAETIVNSTCTEMGYSDFVCTRCKQSYKGNYTDALGHDYSENVTEPTCSELGYTTFTCNRCNDTYKGNFVEALGHSPTEWIVDIPATIEQPGEKHIECTVCGEVLKSAEIPQLIDKDNSDEDGNAEVGSFSLILTDKDRKPVFNSEITIDINDNITIKLPDGRLLDYADQTTITAFYTDTQAPAVGLNIFITDKNSNNATGVTDTNGQLKVPNNQSSTGDNNGTIGGGDEDNKYTYVVSVTNKENIITPDCHIEIGESNDIVVKLPQGLILTQDSPAIITVTDQQGEPQKGVNVIVIGDKDYIEKGVTDMYGKVTVPPVNSGYTDNDGKVSIQGYYVIINNEHNQIANALVTLNEDNTISVMLPAESLIDYANRITVTVLDKDGNPVKNISVTVTDVAEKTGTGITDENGKMTVPPLSEDYTDNEGKAKVNGYNVLVTDEAKPIENAFITISEDNKISVVLPETSSINIENRVTITVTDGENQPVKDMSVTVTDTLGKVETELTDENGKATVPPTNVDYTDSEGKSQVNDLVVIVNNETGFVEKAFVTLNTTQVEPDENGEVKEIKDISVVLPENVLIDYANRITVTILNKADNTPIKDMQVTISEAQSTPETAAKSEKGITNENGKITVPPLNTDYTDKDGNAKVNEYSVIVEDTKEKIENAYIEIKDGKISVILPDGHTLTTSNQTTVTVLDKENKGIQGMSVTVKDTTTEKTAATNANGQVTLPVKSSGGGGGGSSSGGGGGGGFISTPALSITITDKNDKSVIGYSKSTDTKGNITITLPAGKVIDSENWYTVTVKDNKGNAKTDTFITLKDRKEGVATGTTDKDGMLILPAKKHNAYIVGYPDGKFLPDGDMTRAEAAAIFARLIAEEKGESISNSKTNFTDIVKNEWYTSYISYLEKYGIIKGYEDKTFRPDAPVKRAEFVSMTVRFYGLFDEVKYPANTTKYSDIDENYWAVKDISFGKTIGWLNGYADGTFKPDNNITRAEVVTVVNHATVREADKDYINENLSVLNKFTDLKNNAHWGYYDIMESANEHKAVSNSDGETWVK